MRESLRASLGEQAEISIDEAKGVIEIVETGAFLAVNEQEQGWKLIDKKKLHDYISAGLLSEQLVKGLNSFIKY